MSQITQPFPDYFSKLFRFSWILIKFSKGWAIPPSRISSLKWINRIPVSSSKLWIKCVKAFWRKYLLAWNTLSQSFLSDVLDYIHKKYYFSNAWPLPPQSGKWTLNFNPFAQLEHLTLLRQSLVGRGQKDALGHAIQFSSVQFSCSVVSDSLWPHESQQVQIICGQIFVQIFLLAS